MPGHRYRNRLAVAAAVLVVVATAVAVDRSRPASAPAHGSQVVPVSSISPPRPAPSLMTEAPTVPHDPVRSTSAVSPPTPAVGHLDVDSLDSRLAQAADYARQHGYQVGIAVRDTSSGRTWSTGERRFSTESVMKIFIATRLLLDHRMAGTVQDTAYRMITRSDDAAANDLYGLVGTDGLLSWVMEHYSLPNLGTGPSRVGWWGLNHVDPVVLATALDLIKHDDTVWPWLRNAMSHATEYGADGVYQFFGLPQVSRGIPIKQGWGFDSDGAAQLNSVGFLDGARYAVVVMLRGSHNSYGRPIAAAITAICHLALD